MANPSIKINPLPTKDEKAPMEKEVGQLSLDIFKTEKEIIIMAPVAGITRDDITISVTDDVLVIKGIRTPKYDVKDDDYYTRECFWGNFSRSIVLPLEADSKNINATFWNNILEIHIPRKELEKTNIIKIKS